MIKILLLLLGGATIVACAQVPAAVRPVAHA
jgi:hypothetical protein